MSGGRICHVLVCFPATRKAEFGKSSSSLDTDSKLPFPRVYISDSTWLQRQTDIFRFMSRGHEAAFKGYKMVMSSLNILLIIYVVPQKLFQNQDTYSAIGGGRSRPFPGAF